jgi:hypothetical protein
MTVIISSGKKSGVSFPGDFVHQGRFPGFHGLGQGLKGAIFSHGQILLFWPYPGRAVSLYSPVLIKSGAFMGLPCVHTVSGFYRLFCRHAFFLFAGRCYPLHPRAPARSDRRGGF